MVEIEEKNNIIVYKEQGLSNREVAVLTGFNRRTVSKYWNEYRQKLTALTELGADTREIAESLLSKPKYDSLGRVQRKYTAKNLKR